MRWIWFGAGLIVASLIWFVGVMRVSLINFGYTNSVCHPGSGPNDLYLENDGDRELVCAYLKREVGR